MTEMNRIRAVRRPETVLENMQIARPLDAISRLIDPVQRWWIDA